MREDEGLTNGLNTHDGKLTLESVATEFGYQYTRSQELLSDS